MSWVYFWARLDEDESHVEAKMDYFILPQFATGVSGLGAA